MVKITEDLIRKRAEHNEGLISTLEELSLHQQNIEKIEYLDKWCKDLKILYLQSNLISKIENVGRLKKLEYLNLALNNIERIENLEGCEFLNKLDLTVNFIGELTSIKNLTENHFLKELYLTGNPCTDFEGYRDYVIATLPQLRYLDGVEINRSDRIKALQNYKKISDKIVEKENEYRELRVKQKREHEEKKRELKEDEDTESFWNENSEFTPESRVEAARVQEETKKKRQDAKSGHTIDELKNEMKKERRFFDPEGRPYSFNDPKVDYEYNCDDGEKITLVVHVYKYMDSSLIDVDVQPTYVRVTLKGKSLQLALNDEVKTDQSTACRSQVSGDLVITMPKARPHIKPTLSNPPPTTTPKTQQPKSSYLEVEKRTDWKHEVSNIVGNDALKSSAIKSTPRIVRERDNSPDFQDNDEVPPLE